MTSTHREVSTAHRPPAVDSARSGVAAALTRLPKVISRFLREVLAELGKVIWPTRKELITYTTVVLVFVSIMVAVVSGLDVLFAKAVVAVFG